MATYYKYAERTADSQINWAEIGKNMTDMLQQEVAIREEKKAALDEVTRKAAEQISNAPQGQHESAKAEAIRLADQASKYLLMQDRLMKQGLLDPKDYMISRQNLSDGIKGAYASMKAFQDNYARLMERAQKDESSAIELARLSKVQGYGNFNQSGFFIDAPTGNLNVGLKEEQIVDGKKVIGLKKGSTVGMQYINGAIYGQIDKFKYMDPLKQMAAGVGEFVTATITPGTLSSIGYVTTVSDARKRIDAMNIGQDEKKILYDFYASSYDTINSILENQNHKASLLVDAMASKGYFWTDDPDVAAKNPKAVLEVIDPGTGRGVMQFSKEQDQAATDFMMQQFLGMIDVKETKASTGVIPRQDASAAVLDRADKIRDAENFGENIGIALKSPIEEKRNNSIKYLAQKSGRQVKIANGILTVADIDGQGESEYNLNTNPDELASALISAFGVDLPEDTILKSAKSTLRGNLTNTSGEITAISSTPPPAPLKVTLPTSPFEEDSIDAETSLQALMPEGFKVTNLSKKAGSGDNLEVEAPNGKKFPIKSDLSKDEAENMRDLLIAWMKANNQPAEPQQQQGSGTTQQQGSNTASIGTPATGSLNADNIVNKPK
jgi:hypothetical protein